MKRYNSFTELTGEFARREGTALEYICKDGSTGSMSYAELAERIFRRAGELSEKGSGTDIVYATRDPDSVIEIFASAVACRCILMSDPMMPEKVLREAAAGADKFICDITDHAGDGEMLFFTSGTTNRSKVVRLTSKTMCYSAWSGQSMLAHTEYDRILGMLPLSQVYGFVCGLLWGLAYEGRVCLCGDERDIKSAVMRFRPTIIPAVPSMAEALLNNDAVNPELRQVVVGGAPCSAEVGQALRDRGIEVHFGYGLTETSSGIALSMDDDEPEAMYPCPGADIRIEFDGEVTVTTPCMMKGYLGQPEAEEGYVLYTGDLGYMDEKGRLHLQGRKKDLIIFSDGTKINCLEYEHDLAEMSGEADIAIIERDGEIIVVAGAGSDTDRIEEAVEEYNKTMLKSQHVTRVEEFGRPLPRTMTGKIRRYELLRKYQ